MFTENLLFRICLYHLAISASEAWRPYAIEVTNISTFSMVDFIEVNSSISTNGSMSMFLNVLQNVPQFYAKVKITLESSNGNHDLELINKTLNACEFLNNPKYEPIVQVFYKALTKSGNFLKRCPVTKKLYFIKDLLIDPENFPPVMPSKGCIVDVSFMIKNGNTMNIACGYKIQGRVKQV